MKIRTAFSPAEVLGVILALFIVTMGGIVWGQPYLFKAAQWLWLPFLFIMLLIPIRFNHSHFPEVDQAKSSSIIFLSFKILLAFTLMILCYFAWGQGLLFSQLVTYDSELKPVTTAFTNQTQLIWAIQLGSVTWIMASALALSMAVLHKTKISEFFMVFWHKKPHYALIVDGVIGFSVLVLLLFFLGLGCIEFSRVFTAYAGYERPIFPELTALLSALVLLLGYFLLRFKAKNQRLSEKSASIGWMLMSQSLWICLLLLLAQAIIVLFPRGMIVPLMEPVINLFPLFSFENTWMSITLAIAIISVPLLARFFVRIFVKRSLRLGFYMLLGPVVLAAYFLYVFKGLNGTLPTAYFVPITLENVIYQPHSSQWVLIAAVIGLLLCFTYSTALQMALSDLMPKIMGQRLRRLREVVARSNLMFILFCIFYLFFASFTYYFLSQILFIVVTLSLLWVSLYLLYTLISKS